MFSSLQTFPNKFNILLVRTKFCFMIKIVGCASHRSAPLRGPIRHHLRYCTAIVKCTNTPLVPIGASGWKLIGEMPRIATRLSTRPPPSHNKLPRITVKDKAPLMSSGPTHRNFHPFRVERRLLCTLLI